MVALENLREEKYAQIICYPRHSSEELERRLEEMKSLGIIAVEFVGRSSIFNLPILGKGCVSVVILAHTRLGKTALKIRRIDADRSGMLHEAEMLRMANSVNVGPKLMDFTENLLMMEFADGLLLPKWVKNVADTGDAIRIRRVLRDLMEQSWRLDKIGLSHGELSHASRHIIINRENKAYILDFETASISRKYSNVTSICRYLFMRSGVAKIVEEILKEVNETDLIRALRIYKNDRSKEKFGEILRICRLI